MSIWSRFKRSREARPDAEITSPLSPAECHQILTGRDKAAWLGDEFLMPLRLHGTISTSHLSVRMRSGSVSGEINARESGARIRLWEKSEAGSVPPIKEETIAGIAIAIPIVAYFMWNDEIERIPGFALLPALYFARRWYQEFKLELPDYPDSIDELSQMLANHLQGTIKTTPGRD